mmetsp:Transcript_33263/g.91687  ORF Transcript_33263/g.91687 Transcript_33263/m.91687 type:complete len:211 (-) Transcript_33263:470-1102(-)
MTTVQVQQPRVPCAMCTAVEIAAEARVPDLGSRRGARLQDVHRDLEAGPVLHELCPERHDLQHEGSVVANCGDRPPPQSTALAIDLNRRRRHATNAAKPSRPHCLPEASAKLHPRTPRVVRAGVLESNVGRKDRGICRRPYVAEEIAETVEPTRGIQEVNRVGPAHEQRAEESQRMRASLEHPTDLAGEEARAIDRGRHVAVITEVLDEQ